MTPKRREYLRQRGLSEMEIDVLATLALPPVLEALFLAALRDARNTIKAEEYPWWGDLGLKKRPTSRDEARKAYSNAMLKAHPDHGGNAIAMAKVKVAWERAQEELPKSASKQ